MPKSHQGGLALLVLVTLAGCPSGGDKGAGAADPGGPAPAESPEACAALSGKIESLYRRDAESAKDAKAGSDAGPDEAAAERALRAEVVAANVDMVLGDCRVAPSRVVPCLRKARSVAAIESKCLIPLDERGEVEERALARPAPRAGDAPGAPAGAGDGSERQ